MGAKNRNSSSSSSSSSIATLQQLLLLLYTFSLLPLAAAQEPPAAPDDSAPVYEAPSLLTIRAQVTSGSGPSANDSASSGSGSGSDFQLNDLAFLFDTWWKLLVWSCCLTLLFCLCCYCCRCCYLVWDCCTDPFWGCCPRCGKGDSCERFLLLKCGRGSDEEGEEGELEEEEEDEFDEAGAPLTTSTPKKRPRVTTAHERKKQKNRRSLHPYDDNLEENFEEALPHVFPTHYFNLLHLFRFRGGRNQYSVAGSSGHDSSSSNSSSSCNGFRQTTTPAALRSAGPTAPSANHSHGRSHVTEQGRAGRYQALPDAEFELVPVRLQGVNVNGHAHQHNKRKSRSMESFRASAARVGHDAVSARSPHGSASTCNKYSQTDLNLNLNFELAVRQPSLDGGDDLGGQSRSQSEAGSLARGGPPQARAGRSVRAPTPPIACPVPKVPAPTAPTPTPRQNGRVEIEREILYGKETVLV